MKNILVINSGSTSTKIALFNQKAEEIFSQSISHSVKELSHFDSVLKQFAFRKEKVLETLKLNHIGLDVIMAVIGRGGILKPLEAGTYQVNDKLIDDLKHSPVEHASNLGGIIAFEIAKKVGVHAYIADPVSVD